MSDRITIGITHGDINGVGYEIILKALQDNRLCELCNIVVYGSPKVMAYHRKALNLNTFPIASIADAAEAQSKQPNLLNVLPDEVRVELGKPTLESAQAAIRSLDAAVDDLKMGKIDALVTAPIHKQGMREAGFEFAGHTEFLKNRLGAREVLMMMVADDLRLAVATSHTPLAEVPRLVTREMLLSRLEVLHRTLCADFGIARPHIAVLGLNPHAGESGLLGREEEEILVPAINQARDRGIMAIGPFPADGFFGSGGYRKFDAVLAMYHDQGLIPFKALAFDKGVNYTAGLPSARTSPDHGTAFDIAGKNAASPMSLLQSIYLAIDVTRRRREHAELTRDPLRKRKAGRDRGGDDPYVDMGQEPSAL